MILKNEIKINLKKNKVKCHECLGHSHKRVECLNSRKIKGKTLNVTHSGNLKFETSSSFDDENSFMAFSTSVNDFFEIMLIELESAFDNSNSKMALVDANHELSIQKAYNDLYKWSS